jgi:hypothetical protein
MEMDERRMTEPMTPGLFITVAAFFLGGMLMGFGYFHALRATAYLIVCAGRPLHALALTLARVCVLVSGFYIAVHLGGPVLLAMFAGLLCARAVMLRQTRRDAV